VAKGKNVRPGSAGTMIELFAGVGGFRRALEPLGWQTVWANQYEPLTPRTQHAAACYKTHWDDGTLENEDINVVLEQIESGEREAIPDHDLLVGGFPCQDYSVAKTLNQAKGIQGKKGVLWWAIFQILRDKRPRYVLLENVDRLLKSPADQRGRDFAIILSCLASLDYVVEWRVVNAKDYGCPQRRRRVFILARPSHAEDEDPAASVYESGGLAQAFPVKAPKQGLLSLPNALSADLAELSVSYRDGAFGMAGLMKDFKVTSFVVEPKYRGRFRTLRDVVLPTDVTKAEEFEEFFVPDEQVPNWKKLKDAKRQERTAANGHSYFYSEGAVEFPDSLDKPSRTILTGEGGKTPSRFKHVIRDEDGRLRRLTPVELERLNGFPDGWTDTGMSNGRRAFMMGNALVVGLVTRIGQSLARRAADSSV
jgi:DNA (cytosine-5)-methyltransferase 1